MGVCVNNCADPMILHTVNDCAQSYGDANAGALIFCKSVYDDLAVDFTDEALWETAMGIGSGSPPATTNQNPTDLVILKDVVINRTSDFKTAENVLSNGHEDMYRNTTYTITITDPNINESNHDLYGKLLKDRKAWLVIALNDGTMEVSEQPFKLKGMLPSIEKDAVQVYTATAKRSFYNTKSWLRFDAQPAGIFDTEE